MARPVDVAALVEGVRAGRRADVSRAITLVESSRTEHRAAVNGAIERIVSPLAAVRAVHPVAATSCSWWRRSCTR